MTPTIQELLALPLPGLLDVWDDAPHAIPTAGELAEARSRPTAYRWAKDWPTVRCGGRLRVQTVPFLRDLLGIDLTTNTTQETDAHAPLSPVAPAP